MKWKDLKTQLEIIYQPQDIGIQEKRYQALIERFCSLQGAEDYMLARAPGRVNLIGEHTDYNHAPVLPCAVDRDIIGVFTPRNDKKIVVSDFNRQFGSREFVIDQSIKPFVGGDWGNYIKAALQGLLDDRVLAGGGEGTRGFSMMIHSTIPSAAGMSSSSAMVVLSIFTEGCTTGRLSKTPDGSLGDLQK